MKKNRILKGLAMLLSVVMVIGTVFVADVDYARAEEGDPSASVDGDIVPKISARGVRGNGGVQYKIGDEGTWTDFLDILHKESVEDGATVYIKVTLDEGDSIEMANINFEEDMDMTPTVTTEGGYSFVYDASKIYNINISFALKAGGIVIGSWGDSGTVTTEYRVGGSGDFTVSGEPFNPGIDSGEIYIRVALGDNTRINNANLNINGTDYPIGSSDYTKLTSGEYHFTYNKNNKYDFFVGYGSASSPDANPAKLTIAAYTDTYGHLEYKDNKGVWQTVSASGITDIEATELKAVGKEPKYTLKHTIMRGDEVEKQGFTITVTGGADDDNKQTERDFESHLITDSSARLMPGYNYSLAKVEFEVGRATFRWSYEDNIKDHEDEYVGHGKITITGATYNGSDVVNNISQENGLGWKNDSIFTENGKTWSGGEGAFEAGTVVTVTMTPDRGYQLTEFTINEAPNSTKAEGNISTFTFKVPSQNFHLGAKFTTIPDEVDTDRASGVSGGSISTISASDVNAGTVALNVEDVTPSSDEQSKFEEMASKGGYTVNQTLSIGVEQRFYKGVENASRDQCWVQPISQTLTADVDIKLNVSGITGSEVEVLHNHNGNYEVIPATYSNGELSFKTQSFSDFAIVSKGAKPAPSTPSSGSSDSKPEEEVTPVVAKPATLGTVAGGTTVRNWDDLEKVMATKTVAAAKTKSEKEAVKAPIVLVLNQRNSTVPVSTIQALNKSDASGLHLMMGNGAAITISNGAALKNQGAINLANKVTQTKNSKTITFTANTKLLTLGALHMSVPKNVTEAKLLFIANEQSTYLGTFKPVSGQIFFPITQLGTYQLVY